MFTKEEIWAQRRPDRAQARDDALILRGVKPASRKEIARARKRRRQRGFIGRKKTRGGKR